jgi:hypothetical protein
MYGSSVADLTHGPGTRTRTTVNYEKYETRETARTYSGANPTVSARGTDSANLYYIEPNRRAPIMADATRISYRAGDAIETARRKYYLAHPFFQPLQGRFGLIADLGYAANSFDFREPTLAPIDGVFDMTQFNAKFDLSYGITDTFAVMGMARYDSTKYQIDWTDFNEPDDELKDSGLNIFGLGAQWRFADTEKWIGMLSGYFEHQVDQANSLILDLKGGYKIGRSTIYGLARGWYVDFDGDAYGVGMIDDEKAMLLAYQVGKSNAMYLEGGVGIFSVLQEDWTGNIEMIFGDYDWHNQLSLKGAIGWQPGDNFALNLYGKIALMDSADGDNVDMFWNEPGVTNGLEKIGMTKIDGYSDYAIGVQAIFYF